MSEFESKKSVNSYTFKIIGPKAIPYLVKQYNCGRECDEMVLYEIGDTLRDMGDDALEAIEPLKKIISNQETSEVVRRAAELAIINIGGQEALKILISKLEESASNNSEIESWIFFHVAEQGKDAETAGKLVAKWIHSQDRTNSLKAIRTIGYIGYKDAAFTLMDVLESDDWFKVYVASETLGRIEAEEAIDKLKQVKNNHWYPPVRSSADKALKAIQGEDIHKKSFENYYEFRDDFTDYLWAGVEQKPCKEVNYAIANSSTDVKFYEEKNKGIAERFVYTVTEMRNTVEGRKEVLITRTPKVGLKVDDGWLLGDDRGEFGGELVYWASRDSSYIIIDENIQDIFYTPYGIIAVGGLSHMAINDGVLYKILKSKDGKYSAEVYQYLPGASYSNHLLEDGCLLLNTTSGSVLFSPETGFRMAGCIN